MSTHITGELTFDQADHALVAVATQMIHSYRCKCLVICHC